MVIKRKTRPLSIKKAATIRQVAEMAGVSIATVSRVFAESDLVSHELVERVQDASRSLSYQPNRIARNLRTQKTHTAAVAVSDIENPSSPASSAGRTSAARRRLHPAADQLRRGRANRAGPLA